MEVTKCLKEFPKSWFRDFYLLRVLLHLEKLEEASELLQQLLKSRAGD